MCTEKIISTLYMYSCWNIRPELFWLLIFSAEREHFYVTLILPRTSAVYANHSLTHTHMFPVFIICSSSPFQCTLRQYLIEQDSFYTSPPPPPFYWNRIIKSWTKSRKRSVPSLKVWSVSRFIPLWSLKFGQSDLYSRDDHTLKSVHLYKNFQSNR
jgi:hypothetical protein